MRATKNNNSYNNGITIAPEMFSIAVHIFGHCITIGTKVGELHNPMSSQNKQRSSDANKTQRLKICAQTFGLERTKHCTPVREREREKLDGREKKESNSFQIISLVWFSEKQSVKKDVK
jgi:hypothetical protein